MGSLELEYWALGWMGTNHKPCFVLPALRRVVASRHTMSSSSSETDIRPETELSSSSSEEEQRPIETVGDGLAAMRINPLPPNPWPTIVYQPRPPRGRRYVPVSLRSYAIQPRHWKATFEAIEAIKENIPEGCYVELVNWIRSRHGGSF